MAKVARQYRLPREVVDRVDAESAATGESRNGIVETALRRFLRMDTGSGGEAQPAPSLPPGQEGVADGASTPPEASTAGSSAHPTWATAPSSPAADDVPRNAGEPAAYLSDPAEFEARVRKHQATMPASVARRLAERERREGRPVV